jgi:putative oxidoreductase
VIDFSGTVGYVASAGCPAGPGRMAALLVEIIGSVALLLGLGTRYAAAVMTLFTLAASVFFHPFWSVPADQAFVTQLLFFKNIAVAGGLLTLVAHGAGGWSLDARRED